MIEKLIEQLDSEGFCKIPQVYHASEVQKALTLVVEWEKRMEGRLAASIPYLNQNQRMIYNLQNKDYYFLELLFSSKDWERILVHFLNDTWYKQIPAGEPNYILRSYLARSSNAQLPMHIDSFIPYPGNYPLAMQCVVVLEDTTRDNGCTVLVPGSHKSGRYAPPEAFKDAIPIEAKSGDLLVWDSRVWHGALPNKTQGTRWTLIATFVRWWTKQAFDIPASLPQSIYERLTVGQRAILGFCTIPHGDESEGIDLKHGYEILQERVPAVVQRERAGSVRISSLAGQDSDEIEDLGRIVERPGTRENSVDWEAFLEYRSHLA